MKVASRLCILGAAVVLATVAAQEIDESESICCSQKQRANLVPESLVDGRLCSSYECPGEYFHNIDPLDQEECVNGCDVDTCCLTTELYEEYLDSLIPRSNFTVIIKTTTGEFLTGDVRVTNTANPDETYFATGSESIITVYQGTSNHELVVTDVDPAYRLIKEQGGDGNPDGTTKKKADKNRTFTFIYELIRYCSETLGTCGDGEFVQFPSKACVDNTCAECCVPKLCAEFASCDGRKDHSTGDLECTDNVCSNCCGTCYDGELDKVEECEYVESLDKWIVPKGSASGVDSGVSDYDLLDPTKECDSDICIITECQALQAWQRVCMANSHYIPTNFDYTLQVPKFDSSLVQVDVSSIDFHVVGQVTGNINIQDIRPEGTPDLNYATVLFTADLKFDSAAVDLVTVTPNKPEVYTLEAGASLTLGSEPSQFYAIEEALGTIAEDKYGDFVGPTGSTHEVSLNGVAKTSVGGFDITTVIANTASGSFRIRYKYNWCPTPATTARGTFEDHNDACMDEPRNEAWAAQAGCGDGVLNMELGEECDYLAGTNEEQHCSSQCTLLDNVCGDGVVWGSELCDYTVDGNNVEDEFPTYPPPDSTRCRKSTDGDGGTPCTTQSTVCGDGIITDNEDCEYVAGERGQLAPEDEGIAYCLDTCDSTPIIDCTTKRVPLCDCDTEVLYTNYVQTAEPSIYGNPICLDIFGNELTFSAGVAEGLNEGDCICICYNGINDPNEECDVGPEDGSLNSREVCVDCKIVSSYCGDGRVDPLQGEECDKPWSYENDVYYEGGTKFCNPKCKLQDVKECEWLEFDTDCRCSSSDTLNGDIETTYKTVMEAQPHGYLGGCPIEPTYRPCQCDCVGEFQQRNDNKLDGKPPICLFAKSGQCVTQYKFKKTAGVGNWCDHVEGDPLASYLNREGVRSLDGGSYVVADESKCPAERCRACQESYTEEKCDNPCGEGNVVGIFAIDVTPGSASAYGYGDGKSLRCSHSDSEVGNYAIIPDREPCVGTNAVKTWKRTCIHSEVDTRIGNAFTNLAKFYRGDETLPNYVEGDNIVAPDVKSITLSSTGVNMEVNINIKNVAGSGQQAYTVAGDFAATQTLRDGRTPIAGTLATFNADEFTYGPEDTQPITAGESEDLEANFAASAYSHVYNSSNPEFELFMGTSNSDPAYLLTQSSAVVEITGGGGNVEHTITGTFNSTITVEYIYDRCDADGSTFYDCEVVGCTTDQIQEDESDPN